MHLSKPGIRALGVAESYSSSSTSVLAGVVMRRDLRIDGVAFSTITVGGMDATGGVLDLINQLNRQDIGVIMLSGCVIAWYNIIRCDRIASEIGLPVICVTYEESAGLERDIERHFPGDKERMDAYRKLGDRTEIRLPNGYTQYIRVWDLPVPEAARLSHIFTRDGRIPEPVRVARLCARAFQRLPYAGK
jgi:endonuclease V-like protein UPF0215 family